jgi:hypothetical protein
MRIETISFGAMAPCPGDKKTGLNDQHKLGMIQVFLINPAIFLQHLVFSPSREKTSPLSSEIGKKDLTFFWGVC